MATYTVTVNVEYQYEVEAESVEEAEKRGWEYEEYGYTAQVDDIMVEEREVYEEDDEDE